MNLASNHISEKEYSACWNTVVPPYGEFIGALDERLQSELPKGYSDLQLTIDSTKEGRVLIGGKYQHEERTFEIWGEIVWLPKKTKFRGRVGSRSPREPSSVPNDSSVEFRRVADTQHDLNKTSAILNASPSSLVRAFGAPDDADGFKVSGIFLFEGDKGSAFRVHDYEQTNLYWSKNTRPDAPSRDEFWESGKEVELRVAGSANVNQFLAWFRNRLEPYR